MVRNSGFTSNSGRKMRETWYFKVYTGFWTIPSVHNEFPRVGVFRRHRTELLSIPTWPGATAFRRFEGPRAVEGPCGMGPKMTSAEIFGRDFPMFEAVQSGRREGFGAEKPGVDCQLSGTLGILDFGPCLFYDFSMFFIVFLDFYFFFERSVFGCYC